MTATFPEQRTAILTGAASERGIGRAAAHYLAERGWNIGIVDIDDAGAKAAAAAIAERHGVLARADSRRGRMTPTRASTSRAVSPWPSSPSSPSCSGSSLSRHPAS